MPCHGPVTIECICSGIGVGQPLTGLASFAVALTFSPDGTILAAGGSNNTTLLWNFASPAHPVRLGPPLVGGGTSSIESLAFSPAQPALTLAAASTDGDIRWWNLPANVLAGPADPVDTVAFSPDGKTLAAGDTGGTVRLWDLADPRQPARLGLPLVVLPGVVDTVAFSPKAQVLAATTGNIHGGQVWLWDVANPAHPVLVAKVPGPPARIDSLAFSPDGKTLAGASADSKVWLWRLTGPAPTASSLTGPKGALYSVAFSTDGNTLAAAGFDHRSGCGTWPIRPSPFRSASR